MGKSELAKTLATYYFGSQEAMVRLDMSEFMERHTVSKLIGSPPGEAPHPNTSHRTDISQSRTSVPRHLIRLSAQFISLWGVVGSGGLVRLLGGKQVACSDLLCSPCCSRPAAQALLTGCQQH